MHYKKLVGGDAETLTDYMGLDHFESLGGPVRKRDCPNCSTYDHTVKGARVVAIGTEWLELTSANCSRIWWSVPHARMGRNAQSMCAATSRKNL
jgi:hypothetical protein